MVGLAPNTLNGVYAKARQDHDIINTFMIMIIQAGVRSNKPLLWDLLWDHTVGLLSPCREPAHAFTFQLIAEGV